MKDTPLKTFGDAIVDHPHGSPWDANPPMPLDTPFADDRGTIQNLWLSGCQSVAIIESHALTIRANHVHNTDWHATYVVSGMVLYYWRDAAGEVQVHAYRAGEAFFTPPGFEHAMAFPIRTTIVTCSRNVRDTVHHEADVRRVALIDHTVFDDYASTDAPEHASRDPWTKHYLEPHPFAVTKPVRKSRTRRLLDSVAGSLAVLQDRIRDGR